ncbi:N-acetylmuramoyl-L-alanine amidase [Paenibacillus alkalitolerans]|uniref:N-acetylmuramoyl-L-alanine amidase n=1 Tax=Paenibacillus alkalitolerans TaxID=2799335 RepID=UPI0018F3E476|nr:N-acetylmuramoyl-L-alanine amidase [Paenibacillus alkalitolerans]
MRGYITTLLLIAGLVSSPYIGFAAKIVIDPGHGGTDPGAVGVNGLYEKTVNDEVAYRLKDVLLEKGYEVVMTRETDKSMTLQSRVEIANSSDADLFVSVHANSHPSSSIRGTMVLYHDERYPNPNYPASEEMTKLTPESRKLAQSVLSSMLETVPNVNRGLVPSSAYVVRMGSIPSILVELAFLSNAQDAQMLASPGIRSKYAEGIAAGIIRYLPPVFRDIGKHWAKDSIIRLHNEGIAQGSNGSFYPNNELTRAELVAFVDKAFGLKEEVVTASADAQVSVNGDTVTEDVYGDNTDTEPPPAVFADLPNNHWSYASMVAAIENGVIRGYPDGTVRPDQPVTRAEVAAVFSRLSEDDAVISQVSKNSAFRDVAADYWAHSAIMRLSSQGIVQGIAAGVYGPDRFVTRAQMATMIDRKLNQTSTAAFAANVQ